MSSWSYVIYKIWAADLYVIYKIWAADLYEDLILRAASWFTPLIKKWMLSKSIYYLHFRNLCSVDWSICCWNFESNQKLLLLYYDSQSHRRGCIEQNTNISNQKLITYLKRVATIHFFGYMLRDIPFTVKICFWNKSFFFMLQKDYRIVTKHIVIIKWQNLDKISDIPW